MSLRRLFKGATDPAPRTTEATYALQDVVQILDGSYKGEVGEIVDRHHYPGTNDQWLYTVSLVPGRYMPKVWQSDLKPYRKPVEDVK